MARGKGIVAREITVESSPDVQGTMLDNQERKQKLCDIFDYELARLWKKSCKSGKKGLERHDFKSLIDLCKVNQLAGALNDDPQSDAAREELAVRRMTIRELLLSNEAGQLREPIESEE